MAIRPHIRMGAPGESAHRRRTRAEAKAQRTSRRRVLKAERRAARK